MIISYLLVLTFLALVAGFGCIMLGILFEVADLAIWSRVSFTIGFGFLLLIAAVEVLVFGGFLPLPQ